MKYVLETASAADAGIAGASCRSGMNSIMAHSVPPSHSCVHPDLPYGAIVADNFYEQLRRARWVNCQTPPEFEKSVKDIGEQIKKDRIELSKQGVKSKDISCLLYTSDAADE